MSEIETSVHPEAEILKKHPNFRYVQDEYKDIQKATRAELEVLKKKYEKAIIAHELPDKQNRTTIFSDLLSEVEARRQALPVEIPLARKKEKVKAQLLKTMGHDIDPYFQKKLEYREGFKKDITPIKIELSPDIMNDPFWKSLQATMFKDTLAGEGYYISIKEKGQTVALGIIPFTEEEYQKRISKEVSIRERLAKTYGVGEEIRIGV